MDKIFLKVLNMSISASWLVLVVLALRLLLKKAPRWIHVALWALVAVRLICPVSIESAFSLIPSTQTVPEEIIYTEPVQQSQNATLKIVEPRTNVDSVDVELDTTVGVAQTRHFQWTLLWPAGMAAMVLYAAASYLRVKKKVSACVYLDNGVCICDYIDTPFILGIVRPRIYLPSSMEPGSAAHVLAHERAHIARKDHWWKPLGYGLLTVYWFNPVLWLAYVVLCRDIELACDERVIRDMQMPEKKAYSEALLNCSVNRRTIAACPLAFGEVGVKERVKTVLNYKKPAFWIVLTAVTALIVTAVCFLTDPVERFDQKAADCLEEYAYEQVSGRMDRESVSCIDARGGYGLVYCQGEGPTLNLYQYEKNGSQTEVLTSCSGEYTVSGGMSLNHTESGGKHIYFGTISEYHYNPAVDMKTWINWDYLSMTDANGKSYEQDMTGKEGFLFILDAPMADFQAVDGLGTVCIDYEKYLEQGYSMAECWLLSPTASESPFGKYYRVTGPQYNDAVRSSYLNVNTDHLFLLTEGKSLLSMDSAEQNELYSIARFTESQMTQENFDALFLNDPNMGTSLRENNFRVWEYQEQRVSNQNYHDFCYLLQQRDGTLYIVLGQWWDAQYREGESLIRDVYTLQPIESDDPYVESASPYQWTLNLRPEHVQLVQTTAYDPEDVPQHKVPSQRELNSFMQIMNSLTQDQISQGKLKNEPVVSCYVQCMDENGWNADLDVLLQYDGDAVRMVFSTEGAKRYPQKEGEHWIIRSDALNEFLSVYTYKKAEENPFSDPDNAYNWCRNISLAYIDYVWSNTSEGIYSYSLDLDDLRIQELLRILNKLPEEAFEKAEYSDEREVSVNIFCRNVWNTGTSDPMAELCLLNGEIYFTIGTDWRQPYQTWKISSHALSEFISGLIDKDKSMWQQLPVTSFLGLGNDAYDYITCAIGELEMSIPELDCFEYRVNEDGIRFKPENVEGWILVQYRTMPFTVCGTGLETSDVFYKNGKYTGIAGWYDGNEIWSFMDLTANDGDTAHNVLFLNEETAPWVTEYFYEISEVINELGFRQAQQTASYAHHYANMRLSLPVEWEWEAVEYSDDHTPFGIRFRPQGRNGWLEFFFYPDGYAVCGTSLHTEDLTVNDGILGSVGYYDGNSDWSFIRFPGDYALTREGPEKWVSTFWDQIVEILSTASYAEGIIGEEQAKELAYGYACKCGWHEPVDSENQGINYELSFHYETGIWHVTLRKGGSGPLEVKLDHEGNVV